MSDICIVLLAAGNSSRYGSAKLLEEFGGQTLIRRIAEAALGTGSRVLVVTGAYAERIEGELTELDIAIVRNTDWQEGMGTSIATAFRHILTKGGSFQAAIICPADLPLLRTEQLQRLIEAHQHHPNHIIASDWGKAQGAPCLFPALYFTEASRLSGPQGARALLALYSSEVECVYIPEAATDIDTVEDYARLNRC